MANIVNGFAYPALGYTQSSPSIAVGTVVTLDDGGMAVYVQAASAMEDYVRSNGYAASIVRGEDGTPVYTDNGRLYACDLTFRGVEGLYKIRTQSGYVNRSLETWWKYGPGLGRRFLWWRDRDNVASAGDAPSEGSSSPYNYVELAPTAELKANLPGNPVAGVNLYYWDVTLNCWITENGETPLTD